MPADHAELTRVETACAELAAAGQPVTFAEIAARAQISRTTLYRRADLRVVAEEHRRHHQDATTLSGLTIQIDQMRRSLEAVAAKVRRHDETIRRLDRARPSGKPAPAQRVIHRTTPDESFPAEVAALRFWAGRGTVLLVETDLGAGTMLLERLDPTRSLATLPLAEANHHAGRTMRRLAVPAPSWVLSTGELVRDRLATLK